MLESETIIFGRRRAKFVDREKWMAALLELERGRRAKSLMLTREIFCKKCILDCNCSEMCEKFVSETLKNEDLVDSQEY